MSELSELLEEARSFKGAGNKDIDIVLRESLLKVTSLQRELHELHSKKMNMSEDCLSLERSVSDIKKQNKDLKKQQESLKVEIRNSQESLEDHKRFMLEESDRVAEGKKANLTFAKKLSQEKEEVKALKDKASSDIEENNNLTLSLKNKNSDLELLLDENRKIQITLEKKIIDTQKNQEKIKELERQTNILKVERELVLKVAKEELSIVAIERSSLANKNRQASKELDRVVTIRAELALQRDECEKEKNEAKQKQVSLDRNIQGIKNEYNRLEITRLKIEKLIMDNNTIKDLEALRKELKQ